MDSPIYMNIDVYRFFDSFYIILYGDWVGISQGYENIGTRVVLISWEPGSTRKPIILIQFWTWEYWETSHVDSVLNLEILKSSLLSGDIWGKNPFWEHVPGKMNIVTLEIRSKQSLFPKWLPRPNHYAHEICIEILSRTPVSILKYLSPRPQNHMKNSKYSFLAWMSTWISRWRRRRRRADNFSIWPDP